MKTVICHCEQCRACRKYGPEKGKRIQTSQVRGAKSRNRVILKTLDLDYIERALTDKVVVDYYA